MTSVLYQSVSVSTIRRRLSPLARSPPLDDHGPEPGRELELDHRHDRQLVLANLILRAWLSEPDGLPDHLQERPGGYPSLRSAPGRSRR